MFWGFQEKKVMLDTDLERWCEIPWVAENTGYRSEVNCNGNHAKAQYTTRATSIPVFEYLVEELANSISTGIVAGIQQRRRVYNHKGKRKNVCVSDNEWDGDGAQDSVCSILVCVFGFFCLPGKNTISKSVQLGVTNPFHSLERKYFEVFWKLILKYSEDDKLTMWADASKPASAYWLARRPRRNTYGLLGSPSSGITLKDVNTNEAVCRFVATVGMMMIKTNAPAISARDQITAKVSKLAPRPI